MPLVRCEVRNEYGLGLPELYKEVNREDPKAVLDGVAVSGLVGILRQLGDLAEFAAEVFHGLQEQVMITASRSHKLMVRVQDIEAALPPLEKAVLAQTSHLHFCYTAGSEWHPRIRNESNHFIYNDLPRFIMDSYEECRDPPRLHMLDKFDPGGPGSCLKKYSDPTFFKRVSAISNVANAERRRDKKARKSKKKRSWQKNGEVSRSASILNGSGRMQFASPHDYEQTSPAQTVSYTDTTFKSDLGDQSHSFDSRAGSGYIECVFHLSSPMQLDKQDPKESSSSRLNLQNHDNFDSSFLDHTRVEEDDDDFSRSSLQEQAAPNPSCVTWDEKTEIVEPEGQHCDSDEAPDILPTASCQNMPELAVNTRNVERVDISLDVANEQSIPGGSQLDDIESEADNYMDALNTIESESESDFDCQTKREVEPSNFNNSEIESGIHSFNFESHTASVSSLNKELSRDLLDTVSLENFNNSEIESGIHPFNFESHTASVSSLNKELSRDLLDTVSLERFAHEDSPQIAGVAFEQDSLPGHDFSESNNTLDGSKSEAVTSDLSSSRSMIPDQQDPESDKVIKSVGETQESAAEFPGVPSVQFWTNGGLLGLEPSKPPDCRVSNAASQNSVSESKNITSPSGHTAAIKDGVSSGQLDVLVNNSQSIEKSPRLNCSIPCHDNQEDATYIMKKSWGKSSANLGIKHETSGDSHHINRFDHIQGFGLDGASLLTPKTDLPISPDFNVASTDTNQENDRMFGLGHRLLVNGFRRKPSLMHADKFETANPLKSGAFQHKSGHHTVSNNSLPEITFKEQSRNGSSPPLEHMKISFEPMNSFETSKLKLKFPDGRHIQEFNGDMFPSFQLVPEPALPLHEIGSDSDDDTFCRSSSSMSDDCLSHHSQSNSEQWESSETLGSKDHELYGTLCRISSMESISNSLELEGLQGSFHIDSRFKSPYAENIVEPNHCGPLFDLPSFDAVKPSLQQEITCNSDPHDSLLLNCPKEPTPPPPPLPPVQWRILKSHSDITEDEQNFASEGLSHAFDMKDLQSAVPLGQPNIASIKHQQIIAEASLFTPKSKQQDQQKLNGQKAADQDANGKGLDEKDDFLQQIRTKSFNLRRTYTAKPTYSAAPATNVKVTAILEKAIAIRQAVGSDDGEDDDTWSDA